MAKIGIVGGGIAGMYCALHLLRRGHKVSLFETLNRLGGRIETKDLHGFNAECGPMRFERQIEPLFNQLLGELRINLKRFTATQANTAEFPKYELAENEYSTRHRSAIINAGAAGDRLSTANFSHLTTSLDLLKYGIYRIFNEDDNARALSLWEVVGELDNPDKIKEFADSFLENTDVLFDKLRTDSTLDGVFLHTLGFWNALSRVLSPGAVMKVRDTGTFYHLMPENPNASEWSIFWIRLFMSKADLWTVPEGVNTIVSALQEQLEKFKSRFTLRLKTGVSKVDSLASTSQVVITYGKDKMETFEHVILALPSEPMKMLSASFPKQIKQHLSGVIPFTLLKVFVVIDSPWWKELPAPQFGAHLVPTREIHYSPPKKGDTCAMVMFYTDRPATSYWQPFIDEPHDCVQHREPNALKHELALHLSRLLPGNGLTASELQQKIEDNIVDFAIRDWSHAPFGAACHAWKPKINVPRALGDLKAFSITRHGIKNLHVCGEAYSDYQGFIEGSLRSADAVLKTFG